MSNIFYLQNLEKIHNSDLEIVRLFYSPIVGQNAICLYQLLIDMLNNSSSINQKHSFIQITKILQLNQKQMSIAREKLEAIGLLKTFLSKENLLILEIQKPMTINMIANNDLISSMLIEKLGHSLFKELIEQKAIYTFEADKSVEISKKFYEVYDLPDESNQKIAFNFKVNNAYEASQNMTCERFIQYLTNNKPTTSEFIMINNLKKLQFEDPAINLFINYSMKINNLIVVKYIEKIAKDYAKRHIFSAKEIDAELSFAITSKMNLHNEYPSLAINQYNKIATNKNENEILEISGEFDWD